jgi:hypothetical protein
MMNTSATKPRLLYHPIILEELLYKFRNFNDMEFIAALDPEIAEKSLNKLI